MGLSKKEIDKINKQAMNIHSEPKFKNKESKDAFDEVDRRSFHNLQLNQQQVEPLPFGENNPFSTNNMLASYQAFKQQPQFNEVQKFELRNNNTYKALITRADNLRTQANDRLSQARNYVGVHKDLYGNDVQINNLKDYVSYLKNTNNPQGDNQEYINKLYKDEQDALRYVYQSNRQADEIEKIAEAKIKSEAADYTASGSDLAFKRDRINSAISNMPFNSEERNDIARDYRKEYQDITNYKIQEDVWNNVPQDLRNNVQNAVTNNDTDTANKLLKNNGYDDNAIKSIINKAEINRDKNIAIKEENEAKEYARNNPVLASFKSIGNSLNPINNFEAVKELLGYRLGRAVRTSDEPTAETFNQYNEAQRKVNERATMQNEVANNIDNPILKSGYNIAMSTADNLGRMAEAAALDRVLPGSGRFFNGLLASLDVASNEIRNGEERGLNTAQIASTALANAINEQLFETLSFDKIIKNADKPVAGLKDFFKNLISKDTLVNMGIEGSEEAFTDLGNMVADKVLNGSQNELEQNYINLLNAGMSDEEAKKQVMLDKAQSIAESFIAGAVSGGLISTAVGGANYATDRAVNKTTENKTLKSVGKNIISTGNNQRVKNLVENMQIDNEETKKIASDTDWNDELSVGHTIIELINYENDITDNIFKTNMHNELANKLSTLKDNDGNAIEGVDELADRIMNGLSFSPYDSVQEVIKQYKDFMEGKTTESNDYLKNVNNADLKQHSDNLATLARLTTERIENVNTENETTKEQKSLKTQNKASQGIVKNNEKSYVLDNPNQKFDILTLAVDKEGNTKVVAKDSHEYFNPDKVALDRETAQLVEASRDFSKEKKQAFFAAAEEGMSNVANFTVAFNRAYDTGKQGLGIATAFSDAKINLDLNNEQVEKAYQAGLDQYVLNAQNKTKNIQKAKNKYSGTVDTSNININNLDEAQKSALNVLNVLADNVGVDFELFESKTDKEGRYVGENGSYNINNNKIRIDINAGLRVEGEKRNTMIVTLAHELTHSFEFNAPETYAQLQEFVFDKLTKQTKKTADELILEEALKLEAKDKENNVQTKSKDKYIEIAKSEIVARSCERLLTDEAAIKELAYTDQGLFGKIKAWIEQLCENIKAAYRDLFDNEGNLKEGIVAEEANMLNDFENKLRTIWNNAAVEATKNTEKVAIAKNATTKKSQVAKDKNVSTKNLDKTDKKSESKKKIENAKKNFEKKYEDVYKAINDIHAEYLKKNEVAAKRAGLETLDLLNYYTKISPEQAMNDADFSVDGFKNIYKEIYNNLTKADVLFQVRDKSLVTESEIKNNFVEVGEMKPVKKIYENVLNKYDGKPNIQIHKYFSTFNEMAISKYGEISLGKKTAKSFMTAGHGFNKRKAWGIGAIKEVIENGKVLCYIKNYKNKNNDKDRMVIAAPISIKKGEYAGDYYMGVSIDVSPTTNKATLMEMALKKENYTITTINNKYNNKLPKHGYSSPSILSILQQVEEVKNGERKVEDIVTKGIDSDEILKQERDYNLEYNKELKEKYGFDYNTLSDYQKDKEEIARRLKLKRKVIQDFIYNGKDDFVQEYKIKEPEYGVLNNIFIKQFINENNANIDTLRNDNSIKNELLEMLNENKDAQKLAFKKNIYNEEIKEIEKAILGENDKDLIDSLNTILEEPQKIIDRNKTLRKEDEYIKNNQNRFDIFVEKIVDRLLDTSQNPKSEAQIFAENLKPHKSPYQKLRTKVRNGWTIDKIQRELKKESSSVITKLEISKFENIEEILENVFYHGSISANSRLKAGSTLRPEQRTGGYGEAYHSISLSKDKDIASIFASTGSSGNVIPVILKKDAIVIDMKNIEDSIELEEILPELWNKQIDAVKIGDWNKKIGTEKEIVILNPKAIMTIPQGIEYFKNTNKPKFKNLTKNELKDLIKKSTDSDVRYQERYNDALENENLEEVEKIVEDYAAKKGYTQKVYHGTQQFGFTKIDLNKSDDQATFWATDDIETAQTYSGLDTYKARKIADRKSITGYTPEQKIDLYKKEIGDIRSIKYYSKDNKEPIKKIVEGYKKVFENELSDYAVDSFETPKLVNDIIKEARKKFEQIDNLYSEESLTKLQDIKKMIIKARNNSVIDPFKLPNVSLLINALNNYLENDNYYLLNGGDILTDKVMNDMLRRFTDIYKGSYELYANTQNFMSIDAKGSNWNSIKFNENITEPDSFIELYKYDNPEVIDVYYEPMNDVYVIEYIDDIDGTEKEDRIMASRFEKDVKETIGSSFNTRQLANIAKAEGYEGLVIKELIDNGGYGRKYIMPSNVYIFFNPQQQLKSADPVTYDNDGKIIPLDERFNPDNVDIRFQDRYNEKLYQKALAENKMYQELVEKLERQLDLRPYTNITKTDATKLARIIKNNTKTYMKLDELADRIITSFRDEKAEQTTHQDSFWLRFRLNKIVNEAFDRVKEDSKNRTAYANQILGDLRKTRIKLSDAQKKECAYYFGTYNDYRKHMMGKVIFSNNGSSIDHVWNELSMLYPDVFNPDVNDTDMPMMLDSIITELQNMYVSDLGLNKKDAADFIVTELIAEFTGMKPQKTINQIKKEMHNYSVEASRKIRELREKNIEQRRVYEERLRNVNAQLRNDVWLQNEKEALRNGIKRNARYLNTRFLRPRNGAYIPEKYQKAVAEFLYAFEDNTREFGNDELDAALIIQKAFRDSKDDYISQEAESEELSDMLKRLSDNLYGRKLSMLNLQELEETADLLSSLRKIIENAQEVFVNGRKIVIENAGKELASEFKNHKPYKSLKAGEGLKNIVSVNNLTPYYYFDSIGSYASKLLGLLREGQDKAAKNIVKARDFIQDAKKEYNYNKWDFNKKIKVGNVELNAEQAMSLYATYKRQKNLETTQGGKHTTIGGIILDKKLNALTKNGKESLVYETVQRESQKINERDIMQIINFLTDEQIAYADKIVSYLSNEMADLGNEVSMRLHGYKKFKESYYFPYKSSSDWITREESSRNDALPSLKNSGFTKALTKRANNAVIIGDFTETAANHINQMITYNGLAEPQDVVNRVFSYKEPIFEENELGEKELVGYGDINKTLFRYYMGDGYVRYYQEFMRKINGGMMADPAESEFSKWLTRFKKNSVLANLSVTIQQPSAIVRASAYIEPKYFAKTALNNKFAKKKWEDIKKYSGVAILKEIGGYDISTTWGITDYIADTRKTAFRKVYDGMGDTLGRLPGKMDEITWCHIWDAAMRKTKAENPSLSGKELKEKTAILFDRVINASQVYDSMLSRSMNMSSKNMFMKMITAFMSEPTISLNMLLASVNDAKKGNTKAGARKIKAVIGSVLLNSILSAFIRAMRDKDRDKSYIERYIKAAADNFIHDINPLNMMPFVKDVLEVLQGYDVKRTDTEAIRNMVDGLKEGWKSFQNGDTVKGIEDFASAIGSVTGVPIRNIVRDINGIRNTIIDGINNNIVPKSSSDVLEALKEGSLNIEFSIQAAVDEYTDTKDKKLLDRIKKEIRKNVKDKHPDYNEQQIEKEVNARLKVRLTQSYKQKYLSSNNKKKKDIINDMKNTHLYKSKRVKNFGEDNSKETALSWEIQELKKKYIAGNRKQRIGIRKKLYATGHWKKLADLDKQLKKWQ